MTSCCRRGLGGKFTRNRTVIKKLYAGTETIEALKQVSFTLEEGGFIAIMGTSGSGKSTLLNILGALDAPTGGTLTLRENVNATSSLNQ